MLETAAIILTTLNNAGDLSNSPANAKCVECYTNLVISDLNCDQCVDSADVAILLAAWGTDCHDLNFDGIVDDDDLDIMYSEWGCL